MTARPAPTHRFVNTIPSRRDLEPGVIYVSINHTTAVHLCMCGCGNETVTPIRPDGWTISFNGEHISLRPSIGNWRYPCQSHYYITNGHVRWLPSTDDNKSTGRKPTIHRVRKWFRRTWNRLRDA